MFFKVFLYIVYNLYIMSFNRILLSPEIKKKLTKLKVYKDFRSYNDLLDHMIGIYVDVGRLSGERLEV